MVKQIGRINRTKTKKGKRILDERAPKVIENDKVTILYRGPHTNDDVNGVLHDLYMLKKPLCVQMKKKNPFYPFNDETPLERFSSKLDASLFVFGTHSKKHPSSMIFGRMHDGHLLDMAELCILSYTPAKAFDIPKIALGAKPCIVLEGSDWQQADNARIGNLLIDVLRGASPDKVSLQGIEHLVNLTCVGERILLRVYKTILKKSDSTTPRVELLEMGPRIDFEIKRKKIANESLFKQACKIPGQLRTKMRKNVTQDVFGNTLARVHLGKQDTNAIQLRKVKALKRYPAGMEPSAESVESDEHMDDEDEEAEQMYE